MATIRFEEEERELADGSAILEICEAIGMPFGCTEGNCGTCRCIIVEGAENLEPLNEKETDMDLEKGERLACQCIIKTGIVVFSID